jgi:hypothetical protein
MSNFRVGQKCVCVNGDFGPKYRAASIAGPKRGEVVTVAAIEVVERGDVEDGWELCDDTEFLHFAEYTYGWFCSAHFRPLVTRKTSIDWAIAILNGSPVKEGV